MQLRNKPAENTSDIRQFVRFLVVGFANFAISFAIFFFFYNYWKLSPLFYGLLGQAGKDLRDIIQQLGASSLDAALANIIGYAAGIINSFIWNKFWTFKVKHKTVSQFPRFFILNIACLLLSSLSLFIFTDYLRFAYGPVWLVTMGVITVINFMVSKYWVFSSADS
jgi:putative flippase GtrA